MSALNRINVKIEQLREVELCIFVGSVCGLPVRHQAVFQGRARGSLWLTDSHQLTSPAFMQPAVSDRSTARGRPWIVSTLQKWDRELRWAPAVPQLVHSRIRSCSQESGLCEIKYCFWEEEVKCSSIDYRGIWGRV